MVTNLTYLHHLMPRSDLLILNKQARCQMFKFQELGNWTDKKQRVSDRFTLKYALFSCVEGESVTE